ncbi:nonribosomal peptide synthase [Penicillium malachiteum]|uniref:Nonribosomal peptide synthase n=1 Tax=Penicillium malachiteum TaxID=1324776 RepID=A0AAD6HTY8_9EURO|nr:nonribosomal peptide synthase [Penicillium malachiteum]
MTISSLTAEVPHSKSPKGPLRSELCLAWATTFALFTGSQNVTFQIASDKPSQVKLDVLLQGSVRRLLDSLTGQLQALSSNQDSFRIISGLNSHHLENSSSCGDNLADLSVEFTMGTEFTTIRMAEKASTRPQWLSQQILRTLRQIAGEISSCDQAILLYMAINPSMEDQKLMYQWNGSKISSISRCVHEEIHIMALQQPEAPAIDASDGSLTYAELDDLSTRLAIHLTAQGVSNETPVALLFEKSRWCTVAMIAVMKAGGAFVLLDALRPRDYIRSLCQSLNIQFIACSPSNMPTASALARCAVMVSDRVSGSWVNPLVPLTISRPEGAAYIAFTSGSTGVPKGVVIEHRSFLTGAMAHGTAYCMSKETRTLQSSSYSFDGSIMENLTTLLFGGCVCVPSDEDRLNNLPACVVEFKATTICLTPTMLRMIQPHQVPCLKIILLTGEPPSTADVKIWSGRLKLILTYGVTECSVACSSYEASPESSDRDTRSIGKPFACRWWVVSPQKQDLLLPIGAVGELCIEGPIVGRGYISQDASAPYSDAFLLRPGWLNVAHGISRVYKTGDLVQYQADGSLILLGRKDTQIKLHGQRIEVLGIESHLRPHIGEGDDVVVELCKPVSRGEKPTLVAFLSKNQLSTRTDSPEDSLLMPYTASFDSITQNLKRMLQTSLPSIMIPTWFCLVKYWPQTTTGKTDRRRLRDAINNMGKQEIRHFTEVTDSPVKIPEISDLVLDDPAETDLKSLASKALGCDISTLDNKDNFFSKGADSVSVMQLAIAVRATGVPLSIGEIFDNPVLGDLERHIKQQVAGSLDHGMKVPAAQPFSLIDSPDPALWVKKNIAPQVLLSSGQKIIDVLPATQMQSYLAEFPRQYYALHLEGDIDKGRLKEACEALVQRHSILRTVHTQHNGQLFQAVLNKTDISFVLYESATEADMEDLIQRAFRHDTDMPVHMGTSAVQFTLFTSRDHSEHTRKQMLQLRLLHTQEDGDSWLVLIRDLAALYNNKPLQPAISFSDWSYSYFACRQPSTWRYWSDILSGASMSYIGTPLSPKTAEECLYDETKMVPFRKPPQGFTMATAIKAAWSLVLAHHLNSHDVTFGESIHGRTQTFRGVETVVGPCVNIIPVRVKQQIDSHTGIDLMYAIQKQHSQSLEYSLVDIKDIVTNCTDWELRHTSQQWGSFVLHSEVNYYDVFTGLEFGDAKISKQDMFYAPIPVRELILYSMPMGEEHMLTIATNNAIIKSDMAAYLLELTENYLGILLERPDTSLREMQGKGRSIKKVDA